MGLLFHDSLDNGFGGPVFLPATIHAGVNPFAAHHHALSGAPGVSCSVEAGSWLGLGPLSGIRPASTRPSRKRSRGLDDAHPDPPTPSRPFDFGSSSESASASASASASDSSDSSDSDGPKPIGASNPERPAKKLAPSAPAIDDATHLLGISWRRMPIGNDTKDDHDATAAIRGWERYIENHFPFARPRILLQHRGLEAYLVSGRLQHSAAKNDEAFLLFDQELAHARVIGYGWASCLDRLRASPIQTEPGFDVLHAQTRVSNPATQPGTGVSDAGTSGAGVDVGMEMDG